MVHSYSRRLRLYIYNMYIHHSAELNSTFWHQEKKILVICLWCALSTFTYLAPRALAAKSLLLSQRRPFSALIQYYMWHTVHFVVYIYAAANKTLGGLKQQFENLELHFCFTNTIHRCWLPLIAHRIAVGSFAGIAHLHPTHTQFTAQHSPPFAQSHIAL